MALHRPGYSGAGVPPIIIIYYLFNIISYLF